MTFKRLEIYVWWTCNQRCTYCMEYRNMEEVWHKKVSKYDILKTLIKYKKLWYNHVTYLWGEPFIQKVFLDALKIWKKLWYTILVATNCTTLHIDNQSKDTLQYIDELLLSVQAISIKEQQIISRTTNYVNWDVVFENIEKYWKWSFLKTNIVITQDNKNKIFEIVEFLNKKWVKNISVTYPDIEMEYYWKEHTLNKIAPKYTECMQKILPIIKLCKYHNINLKLPDFPFCVFPLDNIWEYLKLTDDYDFETRLKIIHTWEELDRWDLKDVDSLPRERSHCYKCKWCKYVSNCWWPSKIYNELYWLDEINFIK